MRRTLSLEISPEAKLIIRAPLKMTESSIHAFVEKKSQWITKRITQTQKEKKARIKPIYHEGENHLYLGENYPLRIIPKQKKPLRFWDKTFFVAEKHAPKAKQKFEKWYRQQALDIILDRAEMYAKKTGLRYKQIKITGAKTRWGSCTSKGNINFSWRLILTPLWIIDYVVAHEITHLKEHNHSKRFWQKLETIYPQTKEARQWLNKNSKIVAF